jgi:hypothetical protein
MNKLGIATGAIVFMLTTCLSANYLSTWKSMTKVHTLEYPLIVSSDIASSHQHLLPKGTVLYFDKSFPEGFTRYKIYVNIDRMPLELKDLPDPTEISPLEAAAPSKEDLIKLLKEYPLTKSDLESILSSKRLSNEEIKEILAKYVR